MLNRYLGNKTGLLEPIMATIAAAARPGRLVCDVFSGSLAVSMTLKSHGYRVAANDVNLFSAIYAQAFLLNSDVPEICLERLIPLDKRTTMCDRGEETALTLAGSEGFQFLDKADSRRRYQEFLALLHFLESASRDVVPDHFRRTDFFDTYTEQGRKSEFLSLRGRAGRRRFFSGDNGKRIDIILNLLRYWRRFSLISPSLRALLLAVLLDGVEKISNTQGTYHDFPRDSYDPRALKPLRLAPPPFDHIVGRTTDHLVGHGDSLDFIQGVPDHDVLYVDPPYNFRQYTAYYFLPNLICRYPDLDRPDEYFAKIRFVRGQNPDDDFVSTFCKPREFLPSLERLIERARAKTVVLSYFDGRNHWNDFKSAANGVGLEKLTDFFTSSLFRRGSLDFVPIPRLNYQSYGGYKARPIKEYLFIAAKT